MDALALLCTLHADGPTTLKRLRQAECDSLDALIAKDSAELARLMRTSEPIAQRFRREAQNLQQRIGGVDVVATNVGVATSVGVVATNVGVVATNVGVVTTDVGVVATDVGVAAEVTARVESKGSVAADSTTRVAHTEDLADKVRLSVAQAVAPEEAEALRRRRALDRVLSTWRERDANWPERESDGQERDSAAHERDSDARERESAAREGESDAQKRGAEIHTKELAPTRATSPNTDIGQRIGERVATESNALDARAAAARVTKPRAIEIGSVDGLDAAASRALADVGVPTLRALAQCDALAMAQASGLSYSRVVRLRALAQREIASSIAATVPTVLTVPTAPTAPKISKVPTASSPVARTSPAPALTIPIAADPARSSPKFAHPISTAPAPSLLAKISLSERPLAAPEPLGHFDGDFVLRPASPDAGAGGPFA